MMLQNQIVVWAFVLLSVGIEAQTVLPKVVVGSKKDAVLSEEVTARLKVFLTVAGSEAANDVDTRTTTVTLTERSEIASLTLADGSKLRFDKATGEVFQFEAAKADEEQSVREMSKSDGLSRELAFVPVSKLLELCGVHVSVAEMAVRYLDPRRGSEGDSLLGCAWQYSVEQRFEGMPCRFRDISVTVSAFSGRVLQFRYRPVIVPGEAPERVTAEAAIAIASQWCLAENPWGRFGKTVSVIGLEDREASKVIALPNDPLRGRAADVMDVEGRDGDSYYAWELPMRLSKDHGGQVRPLDVVIWVRIDTGEVIGGLP